MNLVDVKGYPGMQKDLHTGAIYPENRVEMQAHEMRKRRRAIADEKEIAAQNQINDLKNEIDDIKSMLQTLINK